MHYSSTTSVGARARLQSLITSVNPVKAACLIVATCLN